MKTYVEYEASDISVSGEMDPVHSFLIGQFLVIGLSGFKAKPEEPQDDPMFPIRRMIADFLNSAHRSGISITKSELPEAFNVPSGPVS
jgi:hypothetical protein